MNTVLQILDNIAEEAARAERTDGQLLDLFVRLRDEEAFAAVVRRHGPMVLGVCRRVLRNAADADDAFQAAFLVLARKAATIGTRGLLAQWLYGVAYNTARKLRQSNTRRAVRQTPLAEASEPPAITSDSCDELLAILDEELARLPERYRAVIVLCDLEGLTRREAASRLACPEGTVAGRLARARALLASHLTARGVVPAAGLLAAVLTESASLAVSPAAVAGVMRTVSVSSLARAAAKGLISPRVAETTEGVLKSMFATKLRAVAAVAACCALALACTVGAIHFANAQPTPDSFPYPLTGVKTAPDKPSEKPAAANAEKKLLTAIPLKKLAAKPTAEKLLKLLPESVTVGAARDENTLLVFATAKGTEDVRLVLRTLGEELPKEAAKPLEPKKYSFRMKNVPWEDVFDFYAKETGLTMITTVKPTGTFTFNPPEGKQFTIAEITDILNESLVQQKLVLIRRHFSFFLHSTDEKLDPTLLPRIALDELDQRGRTELVQVILPITRLDVFDSVDELKKLLSPFGSLVATKSFLVIQDTAGNIARILRTLEAVEGEKGRGDSLDYVCKWRSAQTMADVLKTLLTDKETGTPGTPVRVKNVQIAVDARRNAILITGAPDRLALAKKLIAELDKPRNLTDKPFVAPEPILKTYNVPPGSAAEIAKALATEKVNFKVIPLEKQDQIIVLATPDEHLRVGRLIESKNQGEKPKPKTYTVKFEKTPWKDVFAWYAAESGLARVGDALPTGTFTFTSPVPENPQEITSPALTLDEITDYINESLLAQKWLLVRDKTTFAVIPADEKVDPKWVRRVMSEELDSLGRTELVEVMIQPERLTFGEVDDALKQMVGPFGHLRYLTKSQIVEVSGTAGNVRAIVKKLRELDEAAKRKEK